MKRLLLAAIVTMAATAPAWAQTATTDGRRQIIVQLGGVCGLG